MIKISRKKTIFLLFCLCVLIVMVFIFASNDKHSKSKVTHTDRSKQSYFSNHVWLFNENTAQYSSYIVRNATNTWIESMIFYDDYKDVHLKKDTGFVCFIKIIKTAKVIAIKPTEILYTKIVIHLDRKKFRERKIAIAITRSLNGSVDSSLLKYQIPDEIAVAEPRVKQVALCFHHVYKFTDKAKFFIKTQKDFGIAELVIHDATSDASLADYVSDFEFVRLRPFDLNPDEICEEQFYGAHAEKCRNLFVIEMVRNRFLVEWISLNDCYISMGYQYEFVAVYDVDEVCLLN
jgi:hypothetical protein